MDLVQRIARNALVPLLFAALTCPALQAAGITSSRDLAPNEFAFRQAHTIALAQPEASGATGNLAFVTQVGDNLTGDITQIGNALEAFILQSGYAHEAFIVQHGSHNQGLIVQDGTGNQARIEQYGAYNNALIEQTGTGHRSRVTQNGQGLNLVVRQYR
ncbi:curli production assembly protein CsgB [Pseudomonas sp. KSR10]|jgi:minor curlin subunit|uniref:curli production assembly protein CsgB n=1 Tax=unclassified Pseudomonas TaxID=196821 RepID=UPI001EF825E6|nr:curli production assembly protein CsgB [Pseudomonas sp. KSR10]MCG6540368.1 curli production assembly protein CsgB [Pseudomonas sp. KSR10]